MRLVAADRDLQCVCIKARKLVGTGPNKDALLFAESAKEFVPHIRSLELENNQGFDCRREAAPAYKFADIDPVAATEVQARVFAEIAEEFVRSYAVRGAVSMSTVCRTRSVSIADSNP